MKQTARTKADCAILFGRYIERDGARNAERSRAIAPTCIPNARERCGRRLYGELRSPCRADYTTRSAGKGRGWEEKKRRFAAESACSTRLSVSSGISICFRFIEFWCSRSPWIHRFSAPSTIFLFLARGRSWRECTRPLAVSHPFHRRSAHARSHSPWLLVAYEGTVRGRIA